MALFQAVGSILDALSKAVLILLPNYRGEKAALEGDVENIFKTIDILEDEDENSFVHRYADLVVKTYTQAKTSQNQWALLNQVAVDFYTDHGYRFQAARQTLEEIVWLGLQGQGLNFNEIRVLLSNHGIRVLVIVSKSKQVLDFESIEKTER